jgi:5-formyltetrahydrofolate cyclo-ligase
MTALAGDTFPFPHAPPTKAALRTTLRRQRASLPLGQRRRHARRAAAHLGRWATLRGARDIGVYLAVRSEISAGPLIEWLWRAGRRTWVPVVGAGGRMRFAPLRPGARLRIGPLGLARPASARPLRTARALDLIVLPLVGFDAQGHRLGAGGGYYDRALGTACGRRPLLVGLAYAIQQIPAIPAEPWDVALDAVATERGLRRFRRSAAA